MTFPLFRLRPGISSGIVADDYLIITKASNYTIDADDQIILGNGTVTITLPTPVGNRSYTIKNIHASLTVTVATTGSETIDGASTVALSSQYDAITVISDGSNWHVVWNKT